MSMNWVAVGSGNIFLMLAKIKVFLKDSLRTLLKRVTTLQCKKD
jgi:hypothetical protein